MTESKSQKQKAQTAHVGISESGLTAGMNRRLLLQAGALAVSLSPALLLARTEALVPIPATLEKKVASADFILIGTVTAFKFLPTEPILKVARQPAEVAAFERFWLTYPHTQNAYEVYKKAFPADPALFRFQNRETPVMDSYNFLELKLERVAFFRTKWRHMNMHAPYVYFDINHPDEKSWDRIWKPFLNRQVIIFSQGENNLAGLPTPFPLHSFNSESGSHITDHLPLPISDLPKVTDIALRLKLSRPAK